MNRFTQDTSETQVWFGSNTRRSSSLAGAVEYGLLAMLIITLTSIGATLLGNKLTGIFSTVAYAMQQPGRPQNVVSFGQRTNRKGAPVEREVRSKLSALSSLSPF